MDARARDEGVWNYDDYKLLSRYPDEDIEAVDVGTIATQEVVNIEVSRKIYGSVGTWVVVPALVAPDRIPGGLDREERRDLRDAQRCSNAARIAFKKIWD